MSLTELDRAAVRRSFDRAAPDYDEHAVLQHEVESRLLDRLDFLRTEPARILDMGCGTGIACASLAKRYPAAQVIGLDASSRMLRRATERAPAPVTVCGDMHALPFPRHSVDLVFSSLAVQWSDRLEELLLGVRRVLKPGGMLLFSTFGPDTLHELRSAWARVDDRAHVNRFPDMHDIGDQLVAAGFSEPVMDVDRLTVEYPNVLALMRDLKVIGARNAAVGRPRGLTGRRALAQVAEAYESFRKGEIYPATYEVVYGAAFGPAEGQPIRTPGGEEATFSLESLKSTRKPGR
ncbi:MAG: malonyl-ACP O-methyltransferase BioC [Xanthomonadales bacterium]|nr:malonyl-ACP O-methyltransferase BioC [Xanthomonadales bacterium]